MADSIDSTVTAQDEQAGITEDIAALEGQITTSQNDQLAALADAFAPHDIEELSEESLGALHGMLGLSPESVPDVTAAVSTVEDVSDDEVAETE